MSEGTIAPVAAAEADAAELAGAAEHSASERAPSERVPGDRAAREPGGRPRAGRPARRGAAPAGAGEDAEGRRGQVHQAQLMRGLVLILLITGGWLITLYFWLLIHGVRLERFLTPDEAFIRSVAAFNFIDVSATNPRPSILSLNLEISMWAIFGVVIRTIYGITVALRRGRFDFMHHLVQTVGTLMMGAGLAEIVILLLSITSFQVGPADVTLRNADYLTIAAVAFVLGFYHEDARRWLTGFRRRLLPGATERAPEPGPSET